MFKRLGAQIRRLERELAEEEAHYAAIQSDTARPSVQLAAARIHMLTLGARRHITAGMFRQLPIASFDPATGVIWGWTNLHDRKCASIGEHLHRVWQRGSELRHSLVCAEDSPDLAERVRQVGQLFLAG